MDRTAVLNVLESRRSVHAPCHDDCDRKLCSRCGFLWPCYDYNAYQTLIYVVINCGVEILAGIESRLYILSAK